MRASRAGTRTIAVLAVALSVIGVWQTGNGVWIYVKAQLAQVLLQQAWARTLGGEPHVKPWPWADTWPVARLVVPTQNIDQIVLEGAYGRTLAFGPGHLESSARPGTAGTTILTGHRDTHFRFLERLSPSDAVVLQTADRTRHAYRVRQTTIVDSRAASIAFDDRQTQLALVTCYPFDAITPGGPLRYVVQAELDPSALQPRDHSSRSSLRWTN